MVKLSNFRNRIVPAELDIKGEVVNVKFRPFALTPEREIELSNDSAKTPNERADAVLDVFCSVVVEWDVTSDDGEAIPLDVDYLRLNVPSVLISTIMTKVQEVAATLGK